MIDIVVVEGLPQDSAYLVPREIGDQIREAMREPIGATARGEVSPILEQVKARAAECAALKATP